MKHSALPIFFVWLVVFLATLGAYASWYAFVGQLSTKATDLASLIQAKSDESAQMSAAQATLAALAAEDIVFEEYFVSGDGIVQFLEGLEKTGRTLGADVAVVSVETETARGQNRLVVNLGITGTFESIVRTIGALEYGPKDSATSGLSLEKRSASDDADSLWSATMTLSVGARNLSSQSGGAPSQNGAPPPTTPSSPSEEETLEI